MPFTPFHMGAALIVKLGLRRNFSVITFGIAESTGQNKSKEIRQMLKMGPFDHNRILQSHIAESQSTWIVVVNGLAIDIRTAPINLQRLGFEKGLIPLVSAYQGMQ